MLNVLRLALLAVCLSACQQLAQKPSFSSQPSSLSQQHQQAIQVLNNFAIEGRMAVQYNGRGYSGQMRWQRQSENQQISLMTPLGNTLADITEDKQGVTLITSDGKAYREHDASMLTERIIGWPIPISDLHDWVLGRPSEGNVENAQWDEQGRLQTFQQGDWKVEYAAYQDVEQYSLPTKVTLRHEKIYMRLVVDNWKLSPP